MGTVAQGVARHELTAEPAVLALVGQTAAVAVVDVPVVVVVLRRDLRMGSQRAHVVTGQAEVLDGKDHHAPHEVLALVVVQLVDAVAVVHGQVVADEVVSVSDLEQAAVKLQTQFTARGADTRQVGRAHADHALDDQRVVDHLQLQWRVLRVLDGKRGLELAQLDADFIADGILDEVVHQLRRIGQVGLQFILELAEFRRVEHRAVERHAGALDIERIVEILVGVEAGLQVSRRGDIARPGRQCQRFLGPEREALREGKKQKDR